MGRSIRHLFSDQKGAVAATVALALIGLIAAGGIAFDYSRLAGLHTELQQAADQAALAAASQLDRQTDAITRADKAVKAASNTDRLTANATYFANDGGGTTVEVTTTYCSAFDDAKADSATPCTSTTDATKAQYVVVTTAARVAKYAFTPIVAALSSGNITGKAVAGVQSSVCDIAPLVVCAPNDAFPSSADIGKGIVLKPLSGTSGNYGLLDFGSGAGAVFDALMGFGLNGCQPTAATVTEPGTVTKVTDALNTRLDVYDNKNAKVCGNGSGCTPQCDLATGNGCPAANARNDMVYSLPDKTINTATNVSPTQAQANTAATGVCPVDPVGFLSPPVTPVVGFPRDTCHYGSCPGTGYAANVGDGVWTRQAYFDANHPGMESQAALSAGKPFASLSRYDVYKWESTNAALLAKQKTVSIVTPAVGKPKNSPTSYDWTVTTQCSYPAPPTSRTAYPKQKDRRVLPIVTANCTGISGKTSFDNLRAFDVFLNEPSEDRTYPGTTNSKEIYAEIVGPATVSGGSSGFQYFSRNKPYLIR